MNDAFQQKLAAQIRAKPRPSAGSSTRPIIDAFLDFKEELAATRLAYDNQAWRAFQVGRHKEIIGKTCFADSVRTLFRDLQRMRAEWRILARRKGEVAAELAAETERTGAGNDGAYATVMGRRLER